MASSSTRDEAKRLRLLFVKEVQKNKEILFGKFTNVLTHQMKMEKWDEIRKLLIENGQNSLAKRDANYVSRVFWQNIRRSTMEKTRMPSTGASPQSENSFDEVF